MNHHPLLWTSQNHTIIILTRLDTPRDVFGDAMALSLIEQSGIRIASSSEEWRYMEKYRRKRNLTELYTRGYKSI